MKMSKLMFLYVCFFVFLGCTQKTPFCTCMSDSYPIVSTEVKPKSKTTVGSEFFLTFNPLLLPVKIIYSSRSGFSVVHTGNEQIITPIGSVGIEYSIGSESEKTINGQKITGGDFLVGIRDDKKNKIELFKIQGYNRLKVVTNGRTKIDAQNGYVEINVTNSIVEELTFIDNSKFTIINSTDKVQPIAFIAEGSLGDNEIACEVQPYSYRYYPRFDFAKSVDATVNAEYFFQIENVDNYNNNITKLKRRVTFGEVYQIGYSEDGKSLTLEKKTSN